MERTGKVSETFPQRVLQVQYSAITQLLITFNLKRKWFCKNQHLLVYCRSRALYFVLFDLFCPPVREIVSRKKVSLAKSIRKQSNFLHSVI